MRWICVFSEMSVGTLMAGAPSSSSSARVRSPRCAFHSAITTEAPSLANRSAMPRPMPCPAPVTIATFLLSRSVISPVLFSRQPQHALRDDVALDLGRAARDRVGEREQVLVHPRRRRVGVAALEGHVEHLGADVLGGEQPEPLVELRGEELEDRMLGRRAASLELG